MQRRRRTRGRSSFEELIMKDLEQRQIKYEYETLKLKYVKQTCPHCKEPVRRGTYTPDFIIGSLIVEAKGRFTSVDRTKMLCVQRDNPEIRVALLFQRNQPLIKGSKTTYVDWATRHGFTCAVGKSIPEEWISG